MNINFDVSNERKLQAFFIWITRTGMGVRFGSRPIAWYQMHQMTVLEILEAIGKENNCSDFFVRKGYLYCKNSNHAYLVDAIYAEADKRTRK